MTTETITIRVSPEVARVFNSASADLQRKLEALVSLQLLELARQDESLEDIMRDISRKAQARGLTPEILESILMPYHESWHPLFDSLDQFSNDFMLEREQPGQPSRKRLFEDS